MTASLEVKGFRSPHCLKHCAVVNMRVARQTISYWTEANLTSKANINRTVWEIIDSPDVIPESWSEDADDNDDPMAPRWQSSRSGMAPSDGRPHSELSSIVPFDRADDWRPPTPPCVDMAAVAMERPDATGGDCVARPESMTSCVQMKHITNLWQYGLKEILQQPRHTQFRLTVFLFIIRFR